MWALLTWLLHVPAQGYLAVPLFFNCPLLVCFTELLSIVCLLKIKTKTFLTVLCFDRGVQAIYV